MKVLIVDDDAFARNELKNMIDWEENGFTLCGEASNGYIAIDLLEKTCPDILITDISMPAMDGIELIEHVKSSFPNTLVIALSGYDDFDYVRQSMVKGAKDYILKHRLNKNVLLDLLNKLCNDILEQREAHKEKELEQNKFSSNRLLKRQNFVRQLIKGDFPDIKTISNTISDLELNIDVRRNILLVMEIDDYYLMEESYSLEEMRSYKNTILDISRQALLEWGKGEIFHVDRGRFLFILSLGTMVSSHSIYTRVVEIIGDVRKGIKNFLNLTACFAISKIYDEIIHTNKIYEEALNALMDKFYNGKDKIFTVDAITNINNVFISLTIEDEKNIALILNSSDKTKVIDYIDGIFERIIEHKASYKSVQMICAELIIIVNKIIKEYGLDSSFIYRDNEIPYSRIQKYDNIDDVRKWILDIYAKLASLLEECGIVDRYGIHTQNAIKFINNNFNKDISLDDTAKHIGVSSSYLSRTFKDDCGKGFNEYLNMVRVGKAKLYLNNEEIKLKSIIYKVGFNNYNYFFKVFKNITGMTPVEYRNKHRKI